MGFPIEIEFKIEESSRLDAFSEGLGGGEPAEGAEAVETAGDLEGPAVAPVQLAIGRGSRWIAVAGGLGYVPVAPGTAGSIGGVLLFLFLWLMSGGIGLSRANLLAIYVLIVASILLLGIRAAGRAEVDFGRRDDGRIVIDEVVGQLITLTPLVLGVSSPIFAAEDFFLLIPEVVTGFVLFRLFDVWKPGAIRWAERQFEGGLGVMADDVVAGVYAGLCLYVFHLLVFERFSLKVSA